MHLVAEVLVKSNLLFTTYVIVCKVSELDDDDDNEDDETEFFGK